MNFLNGSSLCGSIFAETLLCWILGPFVVAVDFGEAVGKQLLRGCVRWQTEDWEEGELKKCHSQAVQVREALGLEVRQGGLEKILGD